jgi:HEAT repeat protein
MRSGRVTAIGLVLAGTLAYWAWPCPSQRHPAPPSPVASAVAHDQSVHTTAALHVEAHRAPPEDLAPNIAARWSAIEAMVRDSDLAQLPALCEAELEKEPEAAPAIIHGVASLAVQGSEPDRALAGRTLARWLNEERKRDARDASGNVVNLVEALGDLGGDEAVTSLIDVLDHEEDLALQTTAAERLATLGDARARPAVTRFDERLSRSPEPSDAFEKELRAEAMKTAIDAKARLTKETNE